MASNTSNASSTGPVFNQGTGGGGGPSNPFALAAANSAARRMREQQKAMRDTISSSAKNVKEREEEKRKKKAEEEKAKAAAKAAEEAKKREELAKRTGKSVEDLTGEELQEMDETEDFESDLEDDGGKPRDQGDLADVARNLAKEGGDVNSPAKKRRNVEVSKVTPNGSGGALRLSSFIPHTYRHSRVILDGSVRLGSSKDKDRFEEFLGQIKALITNGKIVDKYFVINPVIIGDGKKDLRDIKDVPTNMTTLGGYVRISQKCMSAFQMKPAFGSNAKKQEGGNEYSDTVFFTIAISCDVNPSELISRISVEWMRVGGVGLYIKEINSFNTESAFVILLLSIYVSSPMITAELRKLLETGLTLLTEVMGDDEIPITAVPPFALRKNLPKLPGVDVSQEYRGLNNKQKQTRRAWHVEMEVQYIQTFERLLDVCKDYGVFSFWGDHVLISRVVDFDSPSGDIERMRTAAMRHTRYQCSMMVAQLYGIINLDASVKLAADGAEGSPELSLRQILPKYLRTSDGSSPLIAELHQGRSNGPVEAVVPKAKVAEAVVSAMNKQMAAYLKYYLMDCGLEEGLVTRLVVASCCPTLVSEINQFEWDEEKRELKSIKEKEDESKLALFEKADWYFDLAKLAVSPQKKKNLDYSAPEALFNWDETQSVNTLHAKNDKRRSEARRRAENDWDSEEEDEEDLGPAPVQHEIGKSLNDTVDGTDGEDGNKSVTWSPTSPSDGRHAGNSAAGGG